MQPCQGEAVCFYAKALYSAFSKVDAVRNQIISDKYRFTTVQHNLDVRICGSILWTTVS